MYLVVVISVRRGSVAAETKAITVSRGPWREGHSLSRAATDDGSALEPKLPDGSAGVTCMMEDAPRQERRGQQAAPLDSARPMIMEWFRLAPCPGGIQIQAASARPGSRDILLRGRRKGKTRKRRKRRKKETTRRAPSGATHRYLARIASAGGSIWSQEGQCRSDPRGAIIGDSPCVRLRGRRGGFCSVPLRQPCTTRYCSPRPCRPGPTSLGGVSWGRRREGLLAHRAPGRTRVLDDDNRTNSLPLAPWPRRHVQQGWPSVTHAWGPCRPSSSFLRSPAPSERHLRRGHRAGGPLEGWTGLDTGW
jgi:hypothetical protein